TARPAAKPFPYSSNLRITIRTLTFANMQPGRWSSFRKLSNSHEPNASARLANRLAGSSLRQRVGVADSRMVISTLDHKKSAAELSDRRPNCSCYRGTGSEHGRLVLVFGLRSRCRLGPVPIHVRPIAVQVLVAVSISVRAVVIRPLHIAAAHRHEID